MDSTHTMLTPTDNTTSTADCNDYVNFRKNIPVIVVLSIFSVIGVLGNSLIIYIYGFHFKKTTTRVFILSLAVTDLITCATLPYKLILLRYMHLYQNVHLARLEFVRLFFLQVSAMILPLVSIDRYRRVCVPLKKQITPKIAKGLVLGVIVLMAGICMFRMAITNEENTLCYRAEAFISQRYLNEDIQNSWLNGFYFVYVLLPFITPLTILVIMYSLVGAKVWNLNKNRATGSRNTQSDRASASIHPRVRLCHKGRPGNCFRKKHQIRHQIEETSSSCSESRSEDHPTCENRIEGDGGIASASALTVESTTKSATTPPSTASAASPRHGNDIPLESTSMNHCEEPRNVRALPPSSALPDIVEQVPVYPGGMAMNKPASGIMSRLKRVTLIFFLITLVYIVSCIPFYVIFLIFRVNPELGEHLLSEGFYIVFYDFVYITVMSNCFLYGFFDPRFRREVRQLQTRVKNRIIGSLSVSEDHV